MWGVLGCKACWVCCRGVESAGFWRRFEVMMIYTPPYAAQPCSQGFVQLIMSLIDHLPSIYRCVFPSIPFVLVPTKVSMNKSKSSPSSPSSPPTRRPLYPASD